MRIAYVISTLEHCGPVNVLYGLVRHLRTDNELLLITLASEPPNSRKDDFDRLKVPVKCITNGRLQSFLCGRSLLQKLLREFYPDCVHAHGFRANALVAKLDVPKLSTVHNCLYEDYSRSYGSLNARAMAFFEVKALQRFDAVVACSAANAAYLEREHGIKPFVIRNGVDQSKFSLVDDAARIAVKNQLGFGSQKLRFISTGGCTKRKNTLSLIRAFNLAAPSMNAELHIFGRGNEYDACRSEAVEGIIFHEFSSNVASYLHASDIFVSSSLSEGMPMAVLEALSCGLPAVLSDIGPHREVANAEGMQDSVLLTGVTVPEIRDGLAAATSLIAPRFVGEFSDVKMAEQYCSLYKDVSMPG